MLCFRQCGHVSEDLRGAARRWHVPRERGKMPHRWDGPTGVVRWRWGACGPPRCLPRATHSLGRLFTLNPINGTAATAAAQPGAGRAAPAQPGSDQCLMPAAGTALLFSPFPSSPFPSPFHFSPLSFLCTFRCVPSLPSSLPRALPAQQTWGVPARGCPPLWQHHAAAVLLPGQDAALAHLYCAWKWLCTKLCAWGAAAPPALLLCSGTGCGDKGQAG